VRVSAASVRVTDVLSDLKEHIQSWGSRKDSVDHFKLEFNGAHMKAGELYKWLSYLCGKFSVLLKQDGSSQIESIISNEIGPSIWNYPVWTQCLISAWTELVCYNIVIAWTRCHCFEKCLSSVGVWTVLYCNRYTAACSRDSNGASTVAVLNQSSIQYFRNLDRY
jgi:hypothetical protein